MVFETSIKNTKKIQNCLLISYFHGFWYSSNVFNVGFLIVNISSSSPWEIIYPSKSEVRLVDNIIVSNFK